MAVIVKARPRQMPADHYGWYVVALMSGILWADYSATSTFVLFIVGCAIGLRLIDIIPHLFLRPEQAKADCPAVMEHQLSPARDPRTISITKYNVTITERVETTLKKAWIVAAPSSRNGE